MLGETDREIFLEHFPEIRIGEECDQPIEIPPSVILVGLGPDLAVDLRSEEVRARELRIARVPLGPRFERIFGQRDFVDDPGIGRVIAR